LGTPKRTSILNADRTSVVNAERPSNSSSATSTDSQPIQEIELKKYNTFGKPPVIKSNSYSIPSMSASQRLGVFSRSLMSLAPLSKKEDDDMESIGLLEKEYK
jgi:hypothetical protein